MLNYLRNYKKSTRKFTWANVRNFFVATYRYYFQAEDEFVADQVMWREARVAAKSPQCITGKQCVKCLCEFPAKAYENKSCSVATWNEEKSITEHEIYCYPRWMNRREWMHFNALTTDDQRDYFIKEIIGHGEV